MFQLRYNFQSLFKYKIKYLDFFFRLVNLQVYLLLHFYFIFHLNQTGHQNAGKPVKIHLQAELNISLSLSSIPSLSLFLSLSDLDIFCLIYFALGVL